MLSAKIVEAMGIGHRCVVPFCDATNSRPTISNGCEVPDAAAGNDDPRARSRPVIVVFSLSVANEYHLLCICSPAAWPPPPPPDSINMCISPCERSNQQHGVARQLSSKLQHVGCE